VDTKTQPDQYDIPIVRSLYEIIADNAQNYEVYVTVKQANI